MDIRLGQLGRRPRAIPRLQPTRQGGGHVPAPGLVGQRPPGAMTHKVHPLGRPSLQPQTHRLVVVLQIRGQSPQGLAPLGAQDEFHAVPFGRGQGCISAQAAQSGVLVGSNGGKEGTRHGRGTGVMMRLP